VALGAALANAEPSPLFSALIIIGAPHCGYVIDGSIQVQQDSYDRAITQFRDDWIGTDILRALLRSSLTVPFELPSDREPRNSADNDHSL
jgi:ligand-binding sensor protein